MREELVSRQYPTASVFNWRTPLYLEALAHARLVARVVALFLAFGLVIATGLYLRGRGPFVSILAMALQLGAVMPLVTRDGLAEPLAGALLALSVLAALSGWRASDYACGLAALFVRELAGLYVGLRVLRAIHDRDWPAVRRWSVGLAAYAVYFGWHVVHVVQAMPSHPLAQRSWLQFSGVPFLLSIVRTNGWLMLSPWWVPPIALAALVVGAVQSRRLLMLTVFSYLTLFFAIGHPFNWYWGWLIAPLLPLAWANIKTSRRADPSPSPAHL
jgi:hypothetical protein